jgi:hypothetical protein
VTVVALLVLAAGAISRHPLAWGPATIGLCLISASLLLSRHRCVRNVSGLVYAAGTEAGLEPVPAAGAIAASSGNVAAAAAAAGSLRVAGVRSAGLDVKLPHGEPQPQGDEAPAMAY